jgi:hypothetical protein
MAKNSKFVKLDKDVLLEYIYDDGNLISDSYNVLVDSRDRRQSYIAGPSSITGNTIGNQLFKVDSVTQKYAKVNPSYYSFLQLKEYSSGIPVRHDTIKIHIPINWTFGEYLGFYIKVYGFDTINTRTFDISNFYFDMTDVSQQYLLNFTSPPLLFQEKLWGKNITINIPSLSYISSQKTNNVPKENSINANLTNGAGLNITSPVFIDFQFVNNIQTVNGVTTYILSTKTTTTVPQTPEFERLGLVVAHSINGDFFEIYGVYNDTIAGFNQFIEESFNIGHRYYIQYNITMYEQNIRGKTTTVTVHDNFNETIEYRPIIKYSTTTAIVDVEMRLIDAVDDSYIIRRASYGMLQDEVSKYSLNLTKINLANANKPKIYNIKSNIDPSLVGISNSMGRINKRKAVSGKVSTPIIQIETVKVPFPILVDRFNIVGRSDNTSLNNTLFYGIGKMIINIYPFDNIITFTIANGNDNKPDFLNMTGYGDIKLTFRNDSNTFEFPLYTDSGSINLDIGQLAFKITQNKFVDIKKLYESGINLFYITSDIQSVKSVVYSGLFKIYDNAANVAGLGQAAPNANPAIIKDPNLPQETAVVTRRPVKESTPVLKPGNTPRSVFDMRTERTSMNIENTSVFTQNQNTNTTEYVLQSSQYPKVLSSIIGMNLDDFVKLNGILRSTLISAGKFIKVPSNINFKSDVLRPKGSKEEGRLGGNDKTNMRGGPRDVNDRGGGNDRGGPRR